MAVDQKMSNHLRKHGPAVDWQLRAEGVSAALEQLCAQVLEIEGELREQASGSQDGYLLDVANRLRKIATEDGN